MINLKGINYDVPDEYVLSLLKRYKFKSKIVKAFAERTGLVLPTNFIALCEEAESWAVDFVNPDKSEPTEERLRQMEERFERWLRYYVRHVNSSFS